MAEVLTEGLVDELLLYFEDNLGTMVDALNDDALKVNAPHVQLGTWVLNEGRDYPAIFIRPQNMGITRYDAAWTDADHELVFEIAVQAADTERIERERMRLVLALWQCLRQRFFSVTADNYFMLHGEGTIRAEYEDIEGSGEASGLYVGRVLFYATFSKQEGMA